MKILNLHKSHRETSADHIGPHAILAYASLDFHGPV